MIKVCNCRGHCGRHGEDCKKAGYMYLVTGFNKAKCCFCTQMGCFDYISFPACDGVLLQEGDKASRGLVVVGVL